MIEVIEKNINGKCVYEVEDHHHALIPWSQIRQKCKTAPHVLTLDHHTDVLRAFRHYDEVNAVPHALRIAALEDAIADLRHDEHFDFAIKNDIIASADIIPHGNFTEDVDPAIRVLHEHGKETAPSEFSRVLESDFLRQKLDGKIPANPYILDIDLDVFKGEKSISPDDPAFFFQLVRKAEAITISRERDWVRLLNLDHGKLSFDFFLDKLYKLIDQATT